MCGIAGFFGHRVVAPETRSAIVSEIARRGPDSQHVVGFDAQLARDDRGACNALLHARLAIIDPRPEADQPMSDEGGDVWICYNGEVYEWQEAAAALAREGVPFRTRSDTEFILRAYQAWGIDCLARLRGKFAFAILDRRRRKVFVARDRMGLKPVVYYHDGREFAFGSTLRAVLPFVPPERRSLSADGIDAYLAHRYVPAPGSCMSAVSRLENGHYLVFDLDTGVLEKHRYWFPQPSTRDWREVLDEAIRIRTVADRPLGVFLSGGIDSTLVACRLAAQGYDRLATYTAAFPGSPMDESPHAAAAARRFGLAHRTIEIPRRIGADFARIVADLDEPFADPSAFPMWYLSRATSREVKVVLGGDGGDELFAGYKRYAKHLRTAWRGALRLPGLAPRASLVDRGAARLAGELGVGWSDAYAMRFSGLSPNQRRFLMPERRALPPHHWRMPAVRGRDARDTLLAIDLDNYLPEYILRKGDLCTMAHGLELRAPLLDQEFYRSVLALPPKDRFTREPKALLAQACPALGELGAFDRKKRGFNPPLAVWLREDLGERLAGIGGRLSALTGGQISAPAADRFVAHYRAGAERLAEQVLQLVILDESLRQLRELR
jgi:asparagine synthase (glutamine-hydrolysing)